jgi:hypothetical protein
LLGRGLRRNDGHPVLAGRYSSTAPQQRNSWTKWLRDSKSLECESPMHQSAAQVRSLPMWVLLLLPFVGLLWVPFYNFAEPSLFGFPFFYWYQLAWVPITSLLIWLVYRSRTPDEAQ